MKKIFVYIILFVCAVAGFGCGANQSTAKSNNSSSQKDAFVSALKAHPRKEINTDLVALIEQGKVSFRYNDYGIAAAAANVATLMDEKGNAVLVLSMQDDFTSPERQVTLYHEYQHVQQILAKRFMFTYTAVLKKGKGYMNKESILELGKEKYLAEYDGYVAGCDMALELNLRPQLCDNISNKEAFKDDLLKFLITTDTVLRLPEPYKTYMVEGITIGRDLQK